MHILSYIPHSYLCFITTICDCLALQRIYKYQSLLRIRSNQQRRKQQRKDASRLNKAHRRDGPKILCGRGDEPEVTPSSNEVKDFWYNLVGIPGECDLDHEAIRAWKGDLDAIECNTERQEVNDIMWKRVIRRIKSWKAPGPDGIYGFWWKVFRSAREALRGLIEGAINLEEEIPQSLVTGRTVLIPKTSPAPRADQYRPIACLNTMYKALTAVMVGVVRDHVTQYDILPPEQCALRSGRRGWLDELMVDSMVTEDATSPAPRADQYRPIACLNTMYKALTAVMVGVVRDHVTQYDILPPEQCALRSGRRGWLDELMVDSMVTEGRNLDVAWIDYRKAFDHVPHRWLSYALQVCKVPKNVQICIENLQAQWRTVFTIRTKTGILESGEVQY